MPWKEIDTVKLRKQFIEEYLGKNYPSFSNLCASYGITRPTGYKWRDCFMQNGFKGLEDKSSVPKKIHHQISEDIVQLIIETKLSRKHWGPKQGDRI
jgi:transposase-like protein